MHIARKIKECEAQRSEFRVLNAMGPIDQARFKLSLLMSSIRCEQILSMEWPRGNELPLAFLATHAAGEEATTRRNPYRGKSWPDAPMCRTRRS